MHPKPDIRYPKSFESMKLQNSLLPFVVAGAMALIAGPRVHANELIVNGGFEDGYRSGVGSGTVPTGWTENAAYDIEPGFNDVRTDPFSGSYNLSIGNFDYQPVPSLSQTFSDVAGDTYTVSMEVFATSGGDPNAFFQAGINNVGYLNLLDTINSYTYESFTFTGSGSDTFYLEADTNPGEWYVDNVSVTGSSRVPDQTSTALLFGFGLAALIISSYHLRRRVAA
jgi:hypothetical protein